MNIYPSNYNLLEHLENSDNIDESTESKSTVSNLTIMTDLITNKQNINTNTDTIKNIDTRVIQIEKMIKKVEDKIKEN